MQSANVAQICEELRSNQPDVQLRVLSKLRKKSTTNKRELREMVEYGDAMLLITLMELLTKCDYAIEHSVVEKKKVALDGWHVLVTLLDLIPPGVDLASRLVNQYGLLDCVLSDLLRRNGDPALFSVGLSCILSLKRYDITMPSESSRIIQAIADMLITPCERIPMTPLFQVLRTLSLENERSSETAMRAVRGSLDKRSSDFQDAVLKSVLQCYKSVGKTRSSSLCWEDPTKWELKHCVDILVHVLRCGLPFEKFTVLKCLQFEALSKDFTTKFLAHNGSNVIASVIANGGPEVREQAVRCVDEIAKLDGNLTTHQQTVNPKVGKDEAEILPDHPYLERFEEYAAVIDFASFKQQMLSECEATQRQGFTLLPKNIEILVPFCVNHGLISVLTELLFGETTSDYVKGEVWELLVHINFELSRIDIGKLRESCDLVSMALMFTSIDYPLALRRQAIVYLTAPLNKYRSIRERLVNDEGAIPILVDLLSREGDNNIANLLSDLLRQLLTGDRNYSAELDLVVQGILDNKQRTQSSNNSKTKRYYLNMLSLYRKAERGILGHEGNDDIENLQLTLTALENGTELEKLLVLKHFRKFAASWGPIQVGLLRENTVAIASVVTHESAELKKIAVEVLRILADLDKGCRENVMVAQAQLWPDDPIFNFHDAEDEDEDSGVEYEYSDQESDNGEADADAESLPKKPKLE